MNAPDAIKPRMQPFLPATADFVNGKDFAARISRALHCATRRLGAEDRRLRHPQPCRREGGGGSLHEPLAGGQAAFADRRHAGRHQGHHRNHRHADRERFALFAGFRGQRDSASVAALREAGAVIVGKTVTTEFAWMQPRETRNPWDLTRTPGGSSSGSAAGGSGRRDQRRARHPGVRLDPAAGKLLRLLRL